MFDIEMNKNFYFFSGTILNLILRFLNKVEVYVYANVAN